MLGSQVKSSADRQTLVKQYAPDLSMRGHKNKKGQSNGSCALHFFMIRFIQL